MKKNPNEIVFSLTNYLKSLEEGEVMPLRRLNELTGHHYVTLKSYIDLIEFIQTSMPFIKMMNTNSEYSVQVYKKPFLPFNDQDNFILFLFDKNAYREANAFSIPDLYKEMTNDSEYWVIKSDGMAYLTRYGLLKAVEVAEEREQLITDKIGNNLNSDAYLQSQISDCDVFENSDHIISDDEDSYFCEMLDYRLSAEKEFLLDMEAA